MQIERALLGARLVQRDDRRVREPRRGERLAGRAVAVDGRAEMYALDRDLAAQQLVVRAPDDAEAAAAELLEQAVAPEHELVGVGSRVAARARDAATRGRIRRLVVLAAGRLDEGLWRLHRLPRSPSTRPVPARGGRKTRIDREVAISRGGLAQVILASS